MQLVEVGGSMPQQFAAETGLEAGCADDTPGVYKMLMVRMWDKGPLTKTRTKGSRRVNGRNAIAVKCSVCGVE